MLVEGSELPETYIKGGLIIKGSSLPFPNIPNDYVSLEQVKFSEPSPNLFNISDPDVALGKYLNNGTLSDNPSYNTSGYIKVAAGESYKFSSQVRMVAYYYNGTSYYSTEQYKTSLIVPSGCNALRFSVAVADWQYFMMVHGSDLPANFVPFGQTISPSALPKADKYLSDIVGGMAVISSMGSSAKISTYDSINANDTIQLTDVPKDAKNGLYFSCRFEFSAFTSIKIGKGYNQYRGAWIEIDGTNIVCKRYESNVIVVGTTAHGLTLSDYIAVSVSTSSESKWKVMLNTSSGMFTTEFQLNYEFCGTAFATFGSASTSVKIDFGNACYKKPVWLFGDSYVGMDNPARWPYYLNQQGYLNIMMNGLAGRGSAAAFSDFENSLKYGCPKYVIWCMGMNDAAATWLENFNKVKRLCEQNGIELILTTVPTTPTQDKETITGYVRSSGLRYIDFYSAVGTDSSGNWYSGMLAGDQVHPTALGAEALAAQVLVDFPEIMQFD
jgi:anaerobic ribonucleoside-triphosphate reductase